MCYIKNRFGKLSRNPQIKHLFMFGCEPPHSAFVHGHAALLQHKVDEVQRETQVPVQGPGHSGWRTKQDEATQT